MVFIRKPIDIISRADGKHYTSVTAFEKALDKQNCWVYTEKEFQRMKEKILDESRSAPKQKLYNNVNIDLNNDRIEKSWMEENE